MDNSFQKYAGPLRGIGARKVSVPVLSILWRLADWHKDTSNSAELTLSMLKGKTKSAV